MTTALRIPVYQPQIGELEKEYVSQCLDSTWISSKGSFIERFEKEFAEYIDVPHATTVSNGTVALHLALLALGIKPGDEVILPTLTYVASANTILHAGAKAVFADSLPLTWQIDPSDILRKITPNTKAVMVVHLYGHPSDMDPILKICRDHNLFLIEDCAEAFGTRYRGTHVGGFGDISTFSFYGNKTITTGEGGMVVSPHESVMALARRIKNQGVVPNRQFWHDIVGYNYRMTNICAAIGLAQLSRADTILEKKRQLAKWYEEGLNGLPLEMHQEIGPVFHSYWLCSCVLKDEKKRDPLMAYLKENGIETRPFFIPNHVLPMYFAQESFPVAESLAKRGMNFPSYPDLTREDVFEICDLVERFFS